MGKLREVMKHKHTRFLRCVGVILTWTIRRLLISLSFAVSGSILWLFCTHNYDAILKWTAGCHRFCSSFATNDKTYGFSWEPRYHLELNCQKFHWHFATNGSAYGLSHPKLNYWPSSISQTFCHQRQHLGFSQVHRYHLELNCTTKSIDTILTWAVLTNP